MDATFVMRDVEVGLSLVRRRARWLTTHDKIPGVRALGMTFFVSLRRGGQNRRLPSQRAPAHARSIRKTRFSSRPPWRKETLG